MPVNIRAKITSQTPSRLPTEVKKQNPGQALLNGLENSDASLQFAITTTKMAAGDDDTNIDIPQMRVKAGKSYEMSYWDGEWKSLGKKTTAKESVMFDSIPPNRLYWVIDEDGRKLERIFTIKQARQKIW